MIDFHGKRKKTYHPKTTPSKCWLKPQKNEDTCAGAWFALLSRVKKRSGGKISFCIRSTRVQFAVSEVVTAAVTWFISASGPVQWNKHVGSSLSSPLPKKTLRSITRICTTGTLARGVDRGALHLFLVGCSSAIGTVMVPWTFHFTTSPPCKMRHCRDLPRFLGYAVYAATVEYRAITQPQSSLLMQAKFEVQKTGRDR